MSNMRSSNKKKSLCEKSMKILVNILKMSSLSLARLSLGKTTTASSTTAPTRVSSTGNHGSSSLTNSLGSNVVVGVLPAAAAAPTITRELPARLIKISQQHPQNSTSKRSSSSYLVDPNIGNESYVVKQKVSSNTDGPMIGKKNENKVSVDNRASNYIKKFHEKNRKDPNSISKSFSSSYIILPPPPPPLLAPRIKQ